MSVDDIAKIAAGYPLIGLGLFWMWRVLREYKGQMIFWRDKAIPYMESWDKMTTTSEVLVREPDDASKFRKVVDLVLERERRDMEGEEKKTNGGTQ